MAASELPEMPNGPIMELHGQRKRFHVPHGLKPLLEDLTREVLRYQPDDINDFLTKYLDTKLAKRKANEHRPSRKSWEWRTWSTDGPSVLDPNDLQEFLDEFHISKEDANKYATKIQAAFRGHETRKSLTEHGKIIHKPALQVKAVEVEEQQEAAVIVEAEVPKSSSKSVAKLDEKPSKKKYMWLNWKADGPSHMTPEEMEEFLKELDISQEDANKYATKIQAAFRGHETRKSLTEHIQHALTGTTPT